MGLWDDNKGGMWDGDDSVDTVYDNIGIWSGIKGIWSGKGGENKKGASGIWSGMSRASYHQGPGIWSIRSWGGHKMEK